MKEPLAFEGRFQWWTYTPSHGQLLLRRVKSPKTPKRIDVLFKNVGLVDLPTVFDDPKIQEIDASSIGSISKRLGALGLYDKKVYRIRAVNCDGHVVAGSVSWTEDEEEYDQPSRLL